MNQSACVVRPDNVAAAEAIHSYTHYLCHYGELTLRKKNRRLFEERLVDNIRDHLDSSMDFQVHRLSARALVQFATKQPWDQVAPRLAKVFGVANIHGAVQIEPSMEALKAQATALLTGRSFRSFAVRCKRVEKSVEWRSQDICVELGSHVNVLTGARVDLTNPEVTVNVQVYHQHMFISVDRMEAHAGLPVGSSGTVAVLLSGGIDSPVAAWRMMRRGCAMTALHFHSHPFTTAASLEKVEELAEILAQWHGPFELAMIPFGNIQQEIVKHAPEKYRVLLYRRLMVRIAQELARSKKAAALVTGESLGQVASQTLTNLGSIEAVADMPIIRPLIGMDKVEITANARVIGTYETSIEPHHDCCGYLEPKQPATRSRPVDLQYAEHKLDIDALVKQGVAGAEWKTIRP